MSEAERLREIVKDYASICQSSSAEIQLLRERIECMALSDHELDSIEEAAKLLAPSKLSVTLRLFVKRATGCHHG